MASNDRNARINQSPVSGPAKASIIYGLGGALSILVGGSCFHRPDLRDEIFTVMYGGLIMGSVVGCIGLTIVLTKPDSFYLYDFWLQMAAYFTTPIVGLRVYKPDHAHLYRVIILDYVVGGLIIGGGCCCCCLCLVLSCLPCLKVLADRNEPTGRRSNPQAVPLPLPYLSIASAFSGLSSTNAVEASARAVVGEVQQEQEEEGDIARTPTAVAVTHQTSQDIMVDPKDVIINTAEIDTQVKYLN
jgi:hypothetical protein